MGQYGLKKGMFKSPSYISSRNAKTNINIESDYSVITATTSSFWYCSYIFGSERTSKRH